MNGDNLASFETLRADAEAGVDDGRRRGDIEGEDHRGRLVGDWGLDFAGRLGSWPLDRERFDLSAFPSARELGRLFLDRVGLLPALLLGRCGIGRCGRRRRDHNEVGLLFLRLAQPLGGRFDPGARGWEGRPAANRAFTVNPFTAVWAVDAGGVGAGGIAAAGSASALRLMGAFLRRISVPARSWIESV